MLITLTPSHYFYYIIILSIIIIILLSIILYYRRYIYHSYNISHSSCPIIMQSSPIHNRGIFATDDISIGDIIEMSPVINFNKKDLNKNSILYDYIIQNPINNKFSVMLGFASIYNHSDNNNALWTFIDESTLCVIATKPINKGEEIFVNYGDQYWSESRKSFKK